MGLFQKQSRPWLKRSQLQKPKVQVLITLHSWWIKKSQVSILILQTVLIEYICPNRAPSGAYFPFRSFILSPLGALLGHIFSMRTDYNSNYKLYAIINNVEWVRMTGMKTVIFTNHVMITWSPFYLVIWHKIVHFSLKVSDWNWIYRFVIIVSVTFQCDAKIELTSEPEN